MQTVSLMYKHVIFWSGFESLSLIFNINSKQWWELWNIILRAFLKCIVQIFYVYFVCVEVTTCVRYNTDFGLLYAYMCYTCDSFIIIPLTKSLVSLCLDKPRSTSDD